MMQNSVKNDTLCSKELDKLNFIWQFDFRLKPIFYTAPAAPKNTAHFKSGQKWIENNPLASFAKVKSKSLTHSVCIS